MMQLQGNLADFDVGKLLHLIMLARRTGTLRINEPVIEKKGNRLKPGEERAMIVFCDGWLARAMMNEKVYLADVLYKAGELNAEQARVIRERGAGYSDKALALVLINANYVTKAAILRSVELYTLQVVYDVMTWTTGLFAFEDRAALQPDDITVSLDLEPVIAEGKRRTQEVRPLEEQLPDLNVALRFPEKVDRRFRGVQLNSDEWRVVSFVNPDISLRDLAKACNLTDTEIRRAVLRLLRDNLVELVDPRSTSRT